MELGDWMAIIIVSLIFLMAFVVVEIRESASKEEFGDEDNNTNNDDNEDEDNVDNSNNLELLTHKLIFKKKIEERFDTAIQEALSTTYQSLKQTDFCNFFNATDMSKRDADLMIEFVLQEMKDKYLEIK